MDSKCNSTSIELYEREVMMLYKIDSPYLLDAIDRYITDCEPIRDKDFERELDVADERYHREREDDD